MKRFITIATLLVMLLMLCAVDPATISAQTVTTIPADALIIASGTTHSGDIATFEQSIVIDGVVEGDVTSITGSIIVRGSVEGDVVSLFGNVIFDQQALAEGNVMAAAGIVSVPNDHLATKGAVFNGNLSGSGATSVLPIAGNQSLDMLARILVAMALGLLATVIAVLLRMLWPRSIGSGAWIIRRVPQQAFMLGLTWSVLVFAIIAAIGLMLILSLIGLALVPVLFLVAQIPSLIGLAVLGEALGQRFGKRGLVAVTLGSAIVLVPCVALAVLSIPAAFGLFYLLTSVGIGGMALLRATVIHRNSAEYVMPSN